LSKIKYSIEDMVRKRENIQMKESIEARFAETLNQIVSTNAGTDKEEREKSPLIAKIGTQLANKL
jgi:hypothetical protein